MVNIWNGNSLKIKRNGNAVPFFLWSGLRDSLGSLSRSPTRTRPPKQPPAVSLLRNGLFEPRILINAKKKHRSASFFSWSGLRDSNSLPPPWQGGALPDELNPHLWCFRTESNHRHGDFQSPALPTELQKHIMATRNGLEPSTSCVTGRRSNQLNYRAISNHLMFASGIIRKSIVLVK